MIHAYDELYVLDAKKSLSIVVDYLCNFCKLDNNAIQNILSKSTYLKLFTEGNPLYISGMSGVELGQLVVSDFLDSSNIPLYKETYEKSPEYWVGWVLAEYCWYSCKTLDMVFYAISLDKILGMYHTYHEMDISRFIERLDELISNGTTKTNLKTIRELRNLSQSQLAKKSQVSLRSIQLYEQKVNDIDKAQAQTLFKLSKALHCSIESLLENPQNDF